MPMPETFARVNARRHRRKWITGPLAATLTLLQPGNSLAPRLVQPVVNRTQVTERLRFTT